MMWLYVIALIVLGVIVVLLVGKWEGAAAPQEEPPAGGPDLVDALISERAEQGVRADDLDQLQFDTSVRGYRMDQVDKLIDALVRQLRESEASHQRSDQAERRDITTE